MIELKGIAWNHTRGFVSVVATAQRYEELHPEVRITWEKRSLQAFADASLEELAERYDLIVMDHPHVAMAAREGILLPLDAHLPAEFLKELAANSVGTSHTSYGCDGHQWTLATDAATPIATWRPDLMEAFGLQVPQTWDEVMALARAGHVTVSLYPLDALMHLYMFCHAQGSPAFQGESHLAPAAVLIRGLNVLKALAEAVHPDCLERNPIRTAEFMSTSEKPAAAYCPLGYGYVNYSRPGYGRFLLKAGNVVSWEGTPLCSALGGAGLAVSARTAHPSVCAEYAQFTASLETQKGIYFESGGQPGHRGAWLDEKVNAASSDFFKDTLSTLDRALLRPQYPGYMYFQDNGTPVMREFLSGAVSAEESVSRLNHLYLESLER